MSIESYSIYLSQAFGAAIIVILTINNRDFCIKFKNHTSKKMRNKITSLNSKVTTIFSTFLFVYLDVSLPVFSNGVP